MNRDLSVVTDPLDSQIPMGCQINSPNRRVLTPLRYSSSLLISVIHLFSVESISLPASAFFDSIISSIFFSPTTNETTSSNLCKCLSSRSTKTHSRTRSQSVQLGKFPATTPHSEYYISMLRAQNGTST